MISCVFLTDSERRLALCNQPLMHPFTTLIFSFISFRFQFLMFLFFFFFKVRSIGMDSEELLKLVETCPSGAETLITRILHIITEKCNSTFIPIYLISNPSCIHTSCIHISEIGWQPRFSFSSNVLASPSTALVKHVKDLYHKRASDVRLLIPVLTGLEKKEVIEVLPKLIKQSPNVVKEVFNRLLGCFHGV